MKNYKSKVQQATLIFATIIGTTSCMNHKPLDTKKVADEKNQEKFDYNSTEKDAQFLVNAAEINREEISLGQLAQQKGNMSHVKELGKMMEDEHTKSLADVTALAKTKSISLPTSQTYKGLDAYEKLNKKSGSDFEKAYSNMMVSGHKDAIALFEKAATECSDLEIKAWASETLPALRRHLDQSLICQNQCEKM